MDEELDEDESEGVGSEIFADLVVEEAVEQFVVEELQQNHQRHWEDEEVEQVVKEAVVFPWHLHVFLVGVGVVLGDVLDAWLHLIKVLLESHYFPLLFLHESNGGEDVSDDPFILLLMILVEPEIINHHEHPSVSSLLQHIQERSDADENG